MKRILFFTTMLLSLIQHNLLAQSNIDSLFQCTRDANNAEFVQKANELYTALVAEDYADSLPTFNHTDSRAYIQAHCLCGLFNYYFINNRCAAVLPYKEQAIAAARATNDSCLITDTYAYLAISYHRLSRYEEALEMAEQSLLIEFAMRDYNRLSSTYNTLSAIYLTEKQFDKAIEYSLKAITIERELTTENTKTLAIRLGMASEIYLKMNQPYQALPLINEALELDSVANRSSQMAIRLAQKGDVLTALHKDKDAKQCFLRAIPIFEEVNNLNSLAITYRSLGALYGRNGDNIAADIEFQKSLAITQQIGNKFLQAKTTYQLYKLYKTINPTRALAYFEQYNALNDTLYNERSQEQINLFRIQYDTQEKEYEISLNKATINRQRIQLRFAIMGIIFALITLGLVAVLMMNERRRREMLTTVNATKDKFFAIISHDLKNPAIAQNNMLQQINDNIDYLDNNSLKQFTTELLKSSNAQVDLLYELLDWSRIQTGRMECQLTPLDLKTMCDDSVTLLQTAAEIKNITLENNVCHSQMVIGDINMVHTIVRNLIQNAIKYTPKEGKITINTRVTNNHILLDVTDTGIGISANRLKTMFRIDAAHSTPGTNGEKGTGLGLLLCHDMALMQHGTLTIQSTEGKGSTFTLSLPIKPMG